MPIDTLPPHKLLADYYSATEERSGFVRSLFNDTARDYDRIDGIMALGSGGWYRRRSLVAAGVRPGLRVLDVAVGTGLLARPACELVGPHGQVIGLDLSERMLEQARRIAGLALIQGRAEQLPLADGSVDVLTMGYALRHVADLAATFREYHRVLKPGGRVLLLEIGRPSGRTGLLLARLYLGGLVPLVCGRLRSGSAAAQLMRYHWDTIANCVPPDVILGALSESGFKTMTCVTELGLFRAYSGSS